MFQDGIFQGVAPDGTLSGGGNAYVSYTTSSGHTVRGRQWDIDNVKNSGYTQNMEVTDLTGEVSKLTTMAAQVIGGGGNVANLISSDPEFASYINSLLPEGTDFASLGSTEQTNALVLYAASRFGNTSNADLLSTAQSMAGASNLHALLSSGETPGEVIGNLSLFYGLGTAYAYKNGQTINNPVSFMNGLLNNEDFKEYLASEAGSKDVAGFTSAMNLINQNATGGGLDVSSVLSGGFNDPEITEMLNLLLNGEG